MMRSAENGEGFLDEWIDGPYIHASVRLPRATCSDPVKDGITWRLWERCLSLFTVIRPLIIDGIPNLDASSIVHWKDLLGTLFVWGDGFRNGQLDLALRDSEDLKTNALADLGAIAVILKTRLYPLARFARNGEPADALLEIQELDNLLEKARPIYKDDSANSEENRNADSLSSTALTVHTGYNDVDKVHALGHLKSQKDAGAEELSQIAKDLGNHIFSLMGLVPLMETSLAGSKHQSSASLAPKACFTVSMPAWPYVSNVRDKFPKADPKLVERLGQANWERHTKITERLDEHIDVYCKATHGTDEARSIFAPSSLFHDSGLGSSSHAMHSNKTSLRTSSSGSHTRENGRLRVPQTPSEVEKGIPFPCSICGHVLHKIKNRNDWKVHVFADLHPYVCTFSSCRDEFVTFATRGSWADHEFSHHRVDKYWNCSQCLEELSSPDKWNKHLTNEHGITFSGSAYQNAIETAENTIPQPYETQQCPFCLVVPGHSPKSFINHVAGHMEDIALAALPRKQVSTSETDSMSSTHTPNAEVHLLRGGENEFVNSLRSTPSPKVSSSSLNYSKPLEEPETRAFLPVDQRPEKCPLETCAKTFDRKFDKNRHTLTHFKGTLVCRFCPQFGSAGLQQFTRVDIFKKHLTERHGAGVGRNPSQQRRYKGKVTVASVICAVCRQTFNDAQTLYRHIDECILRLIERRNAGQSTRRNVSRARSFAKTENHDTGEVSGGTSLLRAAIPEPSSRKNLAGSRLWSHDIPLGVDNLYHCPWEGSTHCRHAPVSLRYELHKLVDEHRKPYRCTNRLCGDLRFSSKAKLLRHEREAQLLHMDNYEYKRYNCPYKYCSEKLPCGAFTRTSELREHIIQQHDDDNDNSSNLPYWSDSSSSSQSPPPEDMLDIPSGDYSWDRWFDDVVEQASSKPGSGRDRPDFPATIVPKGPRQLVPNFNEDLSFTEPNPSLLPFAFDFGELEGFNSGNPEPSAPNLSVGSLLGPLEENLMSHAPNFNYRELPDHVNFSSMLPTQASLPALDLSMANDLLLDLVPSLSTEERDLPVTHFNEADSLSTSPIYTKDPGAMENASPLAVPSSHLQPIKRQRSLRLPPNDSGNVISGHGLHSPLKRPRKARIKRSTKSLLVTGKSFTQDENISMTGNAYEVSDSESNLPKKSRNVRLQDRRTGFEIQSSSESFFIMEVPQEASGAPSPPIEPQFALEFQCPTCPRTYKTEENLSHHLQTHHHRYQCTYSGCFLTFDPIKDFNRHMQTHTLERDRFFCEVGGCDHATNGFSRKDNLMRHMKLFHERDTEADEDESCTVN